MLKSAMRTEEGSALPARFPEEDPNPILQADLCGFVLYANPPARDLLAAAGAPPARLPDSLAMNLRLFVCQDRTGELEWEDPTGRTWSFALSAGAWLAEISLFGRDVTDARRSMKDLADTVARLAEERTSLLQQCQQLQHLLETALMRPGNA